MNTDQAVGAPGPDRRPDRWSRTRALLRLTPNRMIILGLVLTAMFALTAVVGGIAARALDNAGREAVTSASRMSRIAQEIFRGLAEVDAAATGRFLAMADPDDRAELDDRYQLELHRVRGLLSNSAGYTAGDARRARAVARIANQLPVYTGLVRIADEAARLATVSPGTRYEGINDPVKAALLGAAYLREASSYLRTHLLPAAEQLWDDETKLLSEARRDGQLALAASFAVPLATLGVLLWGQRYLTRRTQRRISPGLALATVAMLAAVGWLGVSWSRWLSTQNLLAVIDDSLAGHWNQIRTQREALQARADLYLRLGGNSNQYSFEELLTNFRDTAGCPQVGASSDDQLTALRTAWCQAYQVDIHDQERAGAHRAAVDAALPDGPVARAFDAYDAELGRQITERGDAIAKELEDAPDPAASPGEAVLLLSLLATAGTGVGIWARVREYR